jgi:hypothetical protein
MKHELKIVMSYETEGIDCDETTAITSPHFKIYHDDKIIGCILAISVEASAEEAVPKIKIAFPDFGEYTYTPGKIGSAWGVMENVKTLKEIPNVEVELVKIY